MNLIELQNKIKEFDEKRGWDKSWDLKDLSLNITEEVGEFWNLIKWIDDEKQKIVVEKNKKQVSNFIGDTLFLILKIANQTKIDTEKSLIETLEEFDERMPAEKMKEVKHANKLAGGVDNKG